MNYQEVRTEAEEIAQAVISEVDTYGGDAEELIHQAVDGHQYVIYYARAWELVSSVRRYNQSLFNNAEYSVSDMFDGSENLDQQITVMAFEILRMETLSAYEEFTLEEHGA
jgi:hypothetical protein